MPSPSPDAERAPPRSDSRSRSPSFKEPTRNRSRSRSPRRSSPPRRPKNFSGLKWKKQDRGAPQDRDRDDRDRRGYDEPRRRDDRDRDRGYGRRDTRDRERDRGGYGRDRYGDWDRRDDDRRRDRRDDNRRRDRDRDDRRREDRDPKPKEKKSAAPTDASTSEPMIIVTVNDRLGTKAQIPCMASDPVKVFKAMVAAKIGRQPHEIMLKRQGERPFHDSLTLADYSVSNGVQIDLELNTGD